MAEALALVRRNLGAQAVVLHTRTYKHGGFLGIGARTVVEITAADRASLDLGRDPQRPKKTKTQANAKNKPLRDPAAGDLIRRTYAVAQAELAKRQQPAAGPTDPPPPHNPSPSPPTPPSSSPHATTTLSAVPSDHNLELAEEVRAVKQLVTRLMNDQHQRRKEGGADMPQKLFERYLSLLEQEVAEDLAAEIIDKVRDRLSADQLDDDEAVRKAVVAVIADWIPVDGSASGTVESADGRPRLIALIGPTGVGKTTTIAKLTATFKLKQKKKVALITLDTYRIAAVDQLRTYANILGVPLHVAMSPGELTDAIQRCAGYDVVLIDTAGRSQRDDPRLDHLKSYMEVARPDEVHLVLSSTCSQPVLMDTVERFSCIPTDRIILTKLDEAVTYGVLINVAARVKKSLSYVTTGQEVPHHIEPGRAGHLAEIIVQGKVSP